MSHPGIVQVHDFGQVQALLYIVMEFILDKNPKRGIMALRTAGIGQLGSKG